MDKKGFLKKIRDKAKWVALILAMIATIASVRNSINVKNIKKDMKNIGTEMNEEYTRLEGTAKITSSNLDNAGRYLNKARMYLSKKNINKADIDFAVVNLLAASDALPKEDYLHYLVTKRLISTITEKHVLSIRGQIELLWHQIYKDMGVEE